MKIFSLSDVRFNPKYINLIKYENFEDNIKSGYLNIAVNLDSKTLNAHRYEILKRLSTVESVRNFQTFECLNRTIDYKGFTCNQWLKLQESNIDVITNEHRCVFLKLQHGMFIKEFNTYIRPEELYILLCVVNEVVEGGSLKDIATGLSQKYSINVDIVPEYEQDNTHFLQYLKIFVGGKCYAIPMNSLQGLKELVEEFGKYFIGEEDFVETVKSKFVIQELRKGRLLIDVMNFVNSKDVDTLIRLTKDNDYELV